MKWFRHFSDAHSHPKILRLIQEFGSDGYRVCFTTFEIICQYGDKYLRLSFKKYPKTAIADDFNLPQERIEMIWTCMIDEKLLDGKFYERGILYSKKLKEYADFYFKYLKVTKKRLKRDLKVPQKKEKEAKRKKTEVEAEAEAEEEGEVEGEGETAVAAALKIQKIIGKEMTLKSICEMTRDRDFSEVVKLAEKAKRNAKTNIVAYFRKLLEEKVALPPEGKKTGDFWLDVTPDPVVELVKGNCPGLGVEEIKKILIKIHDHYNAKYEPNDYHKWKWDMNNREIENMVQVAKNILGKLKGKDDIQSGSQ